MNYSQYCHPSLFIINFTLAPQPVTLYHSPRGDHWWTSRQPVTVSQPKEGPLVDITIASYTVSQPKGGPLVDITIASYTISQPKGGPLVNITIATYCITAQGGTIGGHYHGHLLYCSPRGDHWWTLPQPLTISQPKGGPLVDITIASYCITAQGGTIGDITIASYCIAAQGGTIGGHHDI